MAPRKSTMKRKNGKKLRGGFQLPSWLGGTAATVTDSSKIVSNVPANSSEFIPAKSDSDLPANSRPSVPSNSVPPTKKGWFSGGKKHKTQKKSKTQKKKR